MSELLVNQNTHDTGSSKAQTEPPLWTRHQRLNWRVGRVTAPGSVTLNETLTKPCKKSLREPRVRIGSNLHTETHTGKCKHKKKNRLVILNAPLIRRAAADGERGKGRDCIRQRRIARQWTGRWVQWLNFACLLIPSMQQSSHRKSHSWCQLQLQTTVASLIFLA